MLRSFASRVPHCFRDDTDTRAFSGIDDIDHPAFSQHPELERLGDMFRADLRLARKIRDRSRDLEHPVVSSRGKGEPPHRLLQQAMRCQGDLRVGADQRRCELGVGADAVSVVPLGLAHSCRDDPGTDPRGRLARCCRPE